MAFPKLNNTVASNFQDIQCLHLMYSEVAWVLASSGTQGQLQIILELDYLPDHLSVSYEYNQSHRVFNSCRSFNFLVKI